MKKNIRSFIVLILSLAFVSFIGCGRDEAVIDLNGERFLQDPQTDIDGDPPDVISPAGEKSEVSQVTVYVCGAVRHPGVYTLNDGARVVDAIDRADGLSDDADEYYVNQASLLQDGQKVYVPTREEVDTLQPVLSEEMGEPGANPGGLININTADEKTLMTLPGIGEAKARLIVQYRTDNGGFDRIEDIMKIKGIKEGMFNRIKDRICV